MNVICCQKVIRLRITLITFLLIYTAISNKKKYILTCVNKLEWKEFASELNVQNRVAIYHQKIILMFYWVKI